MKSVLDIADIFEKQKNIHAECHSLIIAPTQYPRPLALTAKIARDLAVFPNQLLPSRVGLQSSMGQARLLHDLANIELQAMEMGLRTLYEFPDAPKLFREQLVEIILDESRHLQLCLDGMAQLGFQWGFTPVHTNLWDSTHPDDSLLDRILIVHCYLEASGLDSGELILNKLNGVINKMPREIVNTIADEEIGHVKFGLDWFRDLCNTEKKDVDIEFRSRLTELRQKIPKRATKMTMKRRFAAGFSQNNLDFLLQFSQT